MINSILSNILLNSLILYIVAKFIPAVGLTINNFDFGIFFVVGALFWLINDVLKYILKIMALPFNILSLGLVGGVINIIILYGFEYVVNAMNIGVKIGLGGFLNVVFLSIIISVLNLFIKKL